nr:serine/arginine repetitive matrix protein 1-like [Aegilops tauschii subsp. strangulata]
MPCRAPCRQGAEEHCPRPGTTMVRAGAIHQVRRHAPCAPPRTRRKPEPKRLPRQQKAVRSRPAAAAPPPPPTTPTTSTSSTHHHPPLPKPDNHGPIQPNPASPAERTTNNLPDQERGHRKDVAARAQDRPPEHGRLAPRPRRRHLARGDPDPPPAPTMDLPSPQDAATRASQHTGHRDGRQQPRIRRRTPTRATATRGSRLRSA